MQIIICKYCKEKVLTDVVHNCRNGQRISSNKDHYYGNNLADLKDFIGDREKNTLK